eukprot:TRINITY_DN56051_c0_g1_i1.p1 TRINITY_DN56051_c0_g1~~TRINITY_DN56051_c0_g1_i1.p1  ORF type:complete len:122 (-),score=10.08 TRINITY_DN56051_c0_g1_i1:97-417(-)
MPGNDTLPSIGASWCVVNARLAHSFGIYASCFAWSFLSAAIILISEASSPDTCSAPLAGTTHRQKQDSATRVPHPHITAQAGNRRGSGPAHDHQPPCQGVVRCDQL